MAETLGAPAQHYEPNELLAELKAGIMTLQDGKLVPDKRKGVLRVTVSPPDEPGEVFVRWHVRKDGGGFEEEPEEDFIAMPLILPAEFNQIGNPKSRCFVYRESNEDRLFVWLQEPNPSQDAPKNSLPCIALKSIP
eukprot:jgi/Tetstr1/446733/TSEL_034221.t1